MGWICPNCSNEESFDGVEDIKQWLSRNVTISGSGEGTEYGDEDVSESEVEDTRDVECNTCGRDAVWYNNGNEREELLADYRMRNISWRERMTRGEENEVA